MRGEFFREIRCFKPSWFILFIAKIDTKCKLLMCKRFAFFILRKIFNFEHEIHVLITCKHTIMLKNLTLNISFNHLLLNRR